MCVMLTVCVVLLWTVSRGATWCCYSMCGIPSCVSRGDGDGDDSVCVCVCMYVGCLVGLGCMKTRLRCTH